ncbi:MAG: polysaccharide biosynthesis/export family protein, partial [Thermoguttaceae bacterium]
PQSRRFWSLFILLMIFGDNCGCQSNVFRAGYLPPECIAPLPQNVETINLSGLADTSISSKIIQPGDVLDVSIVTDFTKFTSTTSPIRVGDDGAIEVPLIGKVYVVGMEVEQAEEAIAAESIARGIFRNPHITVTMKECRTNSVTVVGAVKKPGTVELPRGSSSLLNALVAVEGLSEEAGEEVEIRRTDIRSLANKNLQNNPIQPGQNNVRLAALQQASPPMSAPEVIKINLASAAEGGEKAPELKDGDVVYVAKRVLKPVYVIGLVHKPGEYPLPVNREMRVLDAIALAGGCNNHFVEKIIVTRQPPGMPEPIQIAVNFQAAKQGRENIALAPGDTISVEHTAITAATDLITTFVRVGLGASMSLF